jgi:molybdenum cofactor cytidylyltransferase
MTAEETVDANGESDGVDPGGTGDDADAGHEGTTAEDGHPELPVVDPGDDSPDAAEGAEPAVAGVLLAAGRGSRFDAGNKLLATLDGDPVVRHAARRLVGAGLDPLLAVVGYESDRVAAALDGLPFRIVENPAYDAGQSTSVRAAVAALPRQVDAAVFALGDMPRVEPASVRALVDVYRTGEWTALAAAVDGQRGNPVLFDRTRFGALRDVSGDRGGREVLLAGRRTALVETGDRGVRRDVDRPGDLDGLSGDGVGDGDDRR